MNLVKKYDGLFAGLIDSDGEFMMIEAADELPVCATPETCQNRVFIMNGALHAVQDKQEIYINILNSVYQRAHILKLSDKVAIFIHFSTIIAGSTACGKSTQVPQFILDKFQQDRKHCNIIGNYFLKNVIMN